MDSVLVTLEDLKQSGDIPDNVQPMVLVVREKKKKKLFKLF